MATATIFRDRDAVQLIVSEIATGVDRAVEHWMSRVDQALTDTSLTSLGRLYAVKEIVQDYKTITGKEQLRVHERPGIVDEY